MHRLMTLRAQKMHLFYTGLRALWGTVEGPYIISMYGILSPKDVPSAPPRAVGTPETPHMPPISWDQELKNAVFPPMRLLNGTI